MFKGVLSCLMGAGLALILSGCSMVGYLLTNDWDGDADLVVVNDSPQVVYSISLSTEGETETVSDAGGFGLLERGDSYGLVLEGEEEKFSVTLNNEAGQILARYQGIFSGRRLYLTLEADGKLTCTTGE